MLNGDGIGSKVRRTGVKWTLQWWQPSLSMNNPMGRNHHYCKNSLFNFVILISLLFCLSVYLHTYFLFLKIFPICSKVLFSCQCHNIEWYNLMPRLDFPIPYSSVFFGTTHTFHIALYSYLKCSYDILGMFLSITTTCMLVMAPGLCVWTLAILWYDLLD